MLIYNAIPRETWERVLIVVAKYQLDLPVDLENICRSCYAQLTWTHLAWLSLFNVNSCVAPTGEYID